MDLGFKILNAQQVDPGRECGRENGGFSDDVAVHLHLKSGGGSLEIINVPALADALSRLRFGSMS